MRKRILGRWSVVVVLSTGPLLGCSPSPPSMNEIAESYVKLVLAMGPHDADYVDAYYGPPEWRSVVEEEALSLDAIRERGLALVEQLNAFSPPSGEMEHLRHHYLRRQLESLVARAEMLLGTRLSFDQESAALYDAVAPELGEAHFQDVLTRLDRALPGSGAVQTRYEQYRARFVIPPARLDTVFRAAIAECRARTQRWLSLPAGETFTVEYVTDKSWSGYNWYQGNFTSLIQVNTDLPIHADRAIDLACHEGYPGHHTYNALLEKHLVRDRGWMEYAVYALFSPQSLIAEGSANYGIEMAFPGAERVAFERDALFPLAGLDPSLAEAYYAVQGLVEELSYAGNEAARLYLDREITADSAAQWLETYALMAPARARQRVRFIDQYRSYVINYNLGRDLVAQHVTSHAGTSRERAWHEFGGLLSSPRLPSELTSADPRNR